ncbi:MAG: TonB-dependent receptor, partial [Azovibrio sp.]|nr:TonB-dependent receptor [Azovibrio sp.]
MKTCRPTALGLALAAAFPFNLLAQETLDPVVVTAPPMSAPLEVSFDPRAPQQPLPANDGASLLKTVPGMNVTRKGGTDGDPMFRGMAASRLNILLDGEQILGGCGMRMDPPTAYVFPDSYDRVTLLKGPQSVTHGPGASAGTVLFERQPTYFSEPGWQVKGALTGASFGRHEEFMDVKGGNTLGYVQGILTHAQSDDYEDGDGNTVHSRYKRHSATAILGVTPDKDTRLEFSAIRSDGEAAYADRSMDGSKFDRTNYGLKFEKERMGGLLDKVEAQVYYNYVDHVMDNYSLRAAPMMKMVSNPDRETKGGRLAATLDLSRRTTLETGLDFQTNDHTLRTASGAAVAGYDGKPRIADMRFNSWGVFGELAHELNAAHRLIGGLRVDFSEAQDQRTGRSSSGQT